MQFHCPHCGALYEKIDTKTVAQDGNGVPCVVCRNTMSRAAGAQDATFKLIKRPESDTQ